MCCIWYIIYQILSSLQIETKTTVLIDLMKLERQYGSGCERGYPSELRKT